MRSWPTWACWSIAGPPAPEGQGGNKRAASRIMLLAYHEPSLSAPLTGSLAGRGTWGAA
jgi:hypothetical protein